MVLGPALGGLLYAGSPVLVYLLATGMCLVAAVCVAVDARPARRRRAPPEPGQRGAWPRPARPPGLERVLEGLRFVRHTPILLGAILLDLLAVLFGGAVALLPVFARSILHVGPTGLGVLRAAPAVGRAARPPLVLTRWPDRAAGPAAPCCSWWASTAPAIIVFGLSRIFLRSPWSRWPSSGFADLFSMNIRSTTVALATPDRLRGRVAAVEMVFISASNQLGAFESGLAAFLVGTVPAVVGGGAITVLIALSWGRLFPDLARVDRFQDVMPGRHPGSSESTAR